VAIVNTLSGLELCPLRKKLCTRQKVGRSVERRVPTGKTSGRQRRERRSILLLGISDFFLIYFLADRERLQLITCKAK